MLTVAIAIAIAIVATAIVVATTIGPLVVEFEGYQLWR